MTDEVWGGVAQGQERYEAQKGSGGEEKMGGEVLWQDGGYVEAATLWSVPEAWAPFWLPTALVQVQEHEDEGEKMGGLGLETAGVVPEPSVPEGLFPPEPSMKLSGPGAEDRGRDLAPAGGDGSGAHVQHD